MMGGLPDSIDPTKPPRNFKDASSREDSHQWIDAYYKECKGMMDRGAVKAVKPPPGAKILGTTTRLEYKCDNSVFSKRTCHRCVRGESLETSRWKEKISSSRNCMHLSSRHKRRA